jgi:hypothetical protein
MGFHKLASHLQRERRKHLEFALALAYSIRRFQVPRGADSMMAESNSGEKFSEVHFSK